MIGSGIPASYGAATGVLVFSDESMYKYLDEGKNCILYRKYATVDEPCDYNVCKSTYLLL
jgi:hypothetical protein